MWGAQPSRAPCFGYPVNQWLPGHEWATPPIPGVPSLSHRGSRFASGTGVTGAGGAGANGADAHAHGPSHNHAPPANADEHTDLPARACVALPLFDPRYGRTEPSDHAGPSAAVDLYPPARSCHSHAAARRTAHDPAPRDRAGLPLADARHVGTGSAARRGAPLAERPAGTWLPLARGEPDCGISNRASNQPGGTRSPLGHRPLAGNGHAAAPDRDPGLAAGTQPSAVVPT